MQDEGKDEKKEKQPIDMTTDEALDYVFAPEIAEALRREAAKTEDRKQPEPEQDC